MLISQSTSYLKRRDEALFADLYLTRYLTTPQIAELYFLMEDPNDPASEPTIPSPGAAERRLYRLANLGWLANHSGLRTSLGNTYKLWVLSEEAFHREREEFADSKEQKIPAAPKIGRLDHLVHTNDLYVACAPTLRFLLGEPDSDGSESWTWRYEGKVPREITTRGEPRKLRPDAEIKIADTLFFVEYQTRESHVTVEKMQDKATNYAHYVANVLRVEPDQAQLLLVTDQPRIADGTLARARRDGLRATAGTPSQINEHLINHLQGM